MLHQVGLLLLAIDYYWYFGAFAFQVSECAFQFFSFLTTRQVFKDGLILHLKVVDFGGELQRRGKASKSGVSKTTKFEEERE